MQLSSCKNTTVLQDHKNTKYVPALIGKGSGKSAEMENCENEHPKTDAKRQLSGTLNFVIYITGCATHITSARILYHP